jgi:hypothetical protein
MISSDPGGFHAPKDSENPLWSFWGELSELELDLCLYDIPMTITMIFGVIIDHRYLNISYFKRHET